MTIATTRRPGIPPAFVRRGLPQVHRAERAPDEGVLQRPGRLRPHELLGLARSHSLQVAAWDQQHAGALVERRYELLDRTADFELWVIYWPTDTGLVLHDHGGSSGAFLVVGGVLEETSTSLHDQRFRLRCLGTGQGTSFGASYVHSVTNPHAAPATSVHAYSPPLTSMTFYDQSPAGLMVTRVETEWDGAP